MPIRKPKLGIKKAPPPQTEQLDNAPVPALSNDIDDIPLPKGSYNFDPNKWDDPNFNPFSTSTGIPNSPGLSKGSYNFDPDSFEGSIDTFKSSKEMGNSPPKAATFDKSNDNENDNDNMVELEDHNQNKPAKNKKKPLKSKSSNVSSLCCFFNTFRVKKSPKRTQITEPSAQCCPVCSPLSPSTSHTHNHLQEKYPYSNTNPSQDHATDEEKLASSTSQKWTRHDVEVELNSDPQDFPQPTDFTAFVNENSLPAQSDVTDYEIEYMEKIGSSAPPLSVKKPSLYLKLDSVTDSPTKTSNMQDSEPNSPCTGSFEEMEAQISQGKSPVLPPCGARDSLVSEKSRKRDSQSQSRTQSVERDGASPIQGPMDPSDLPLLDRLSDSPAPLSYLEPDLAETNPTAFAQKLQQRETASPGDSGVSRCSLYSRTGYIEGESPHLPRDMDHSLGIAREEIVVKEKEAMEWKRKYEESRREVEEMRRIVMEYEKTIAEMIDKSFVPLDPNTGQLQAQAFMSPFIFHLT
ncbi:transforming acidic coiled-coil-containing protein 2-like isoform X9 [Cyprinus carpio]|uniref:Transforming acidic coiled-coil-containing protein 2-like isoform X9 n=1 Tax=Cyprinus carpio TaxID=7962 RepID=A0A9R0ABX3_CYPCA|nr:transforming acidic coiled-coil-containing protein 2-like isoform X9 [Cyprinus carpio]